ncbi:hypothetical protein FOA52_003763 [Chlamydomonas sp. UWO 241]|nr:hypothetical protein FOA52_003763 [Chlamydomonas sp. UWO 241]
MGCASSSNGAEQGEKGPAVISTSNNASELASANPVSEASAATNGVHGGSAKSSKAVESAVPGVTAEMTVPSGDNGDGGTLPRGGSLDTQGSIQAPLRQEAAEGQVDRALAVGGGSGAGTLQPGGDEVGTPPRALGSVSSHGLNASMRAGAGGAPGGLNGSMRRDAGGASGGLDGNGLNASMRGAGGASGGLNASIRGAGGASGGLNASMRGAGGPSGGLNSSMRGASGGLNASLRAGASAHMGGGAEPELLNPEPAGSHEQQQQQQPEPAAAAPPQLPAAVDVVDDEPAPPLPRAPPPVDPDDPWSAIQSKYADVRSPGAAAAAAPPPRAKRAPVDSDSDDDDVVMLEGPNPRSYAPSMAMSNSVFEAPVGRLRAQGSNGSTSGGGGGGSTSGGGGGPRAGGWGDGALAANGTLMLGDQVSGPKRAPHAHTHAPPAPDNTREAVDPGVRGGTKDDLGLEDMEDMDVDALINQEEANGGLNPDLAAKLRAFEDMGGEDDE